VIFPQPYLRPNTKSKTILYIRNALSDALKSLYLRYTAIPEVHAHS
jgi:hypothetical protein